MKKSIAYLWMLSSFILVLLLSLSCEISNPADGLEVRIKTKSRSTTVALEIRNSSTTYSVITPVLITFEGEGKEDIISTTSVPLSLVTSNEGIAQFSITDSLTPSKDNPFKVTMIFKAQGYLTTSMPIELTKTGLTIYNINLVEKTNLPEGAANNTETTGTTNSESGTSQDIILNSGAEPVTGAVASVTIPKGTKLLGVNGETLQGTVTTSVTYFNPISEKTLNSFPGGLDAVNVSDNGTPEATSFYTAGFVSVDLTVNGVEVSKLENGTLSIDMQIPDSTINPETNRPIAPGDVVPLWSYDEITNVWTHEQDITIADNGNFKVAKCRNISHLSYFNLDWKVNDRCAYGTTIKFQSLLNTAERLKVKFYLEYMSGNKVYYRFRGSRIVSYNDPYIQFINSPSDRGGIVEYYTMYDNEILGTYYIDDLCSDDTITIEYTPIDTTNTTNVVLSAYVECESYATNPKIIYIDGIPVYTMRVNADGTPYDGIINWYNVGQFNNNTLPPVRMVLNGYYVFKILYNGDWYHTLDYDEPPYLINKERLHYDIIDDDRICRYF